MKIKCFSGPDRLDLCVRLERMLEQQKLSRIISVCYNCHTGEYVAFFEVV